MKIKDIQHQIIYKDQHAYCAHPLIVRARNGDWLVIFNKSARRAYILHPPEDPLFYNVIIRSQDEGHTWSIPRVAPGYDWHGVETAGLTPLRSGRILFAQYKFKWFPLETALKISPRPQDLIFPQDWMAWAIGSGEHDTGDVYPEQPEELAPWARANGSTFIHISDDNGCTWDRTVEIDTHPYTGGYGKCPGVELPNGEIILPLSDVPQYEKIFIIRSNDGGVNWEKPLEAANLPGHYFEEPTILSLPDGKILMLLRDNSSHILYQTISDDNGFSWPVPVPTNIWGYPAHLTLMPDGKILCVYGYRSEPFGIRLALSHDLGATWDTENIFEIRNDFPNRDLGYPSAVLATDGSIYCVYYGQDVDGVTCIQSSRFYMET